MKCLYVQSSSSKACLSYRFIYENPQKKQRIFLGHGEIKLEMWEKTFLLNTSLELWAVCLYSLNQTKSNWVFKYTIWTKYWVTPFNLLPEVYKIKHLAMQLAFTTLVKEWVVLKSSLVAEVSSYHSTNAWIQSILSLGAERGAQVLKCRQCSVDSAQKLCAGSFTAYVCKAEQHLCV